MSVFSGLIFFQNPGFDFSIASTDKTIMVNTTVIDASGNYSPQLVLMISSHLFDTKPLLTRHQNYFEKCLVEFDMKI